MTSLTLNLESVELTDEQFFQLCQNNRELKFERDSNGDIVIMTPTGGETSNRNIEIAYQLQAWSRQHRDLGIAFDSSVGFKLPIVADRSPDAAWVNSESWNALNSEQRCKFVPLCPDFVIELRSPGDRLKTIQEKLVEYMENGTRLGWLIDAQNKKIEVYRPGQPIEILDAPKTCSGESILPDLIFTFELIW
ncbi:MAG: Uma2 family endonuclease [Microcoleaceae cyanobacterium]